MYGAILIYLLLIICFSDCLDYTVEIKNGTIRGKPITTIHDRVIYGFIEIPYASPPVGRLRFKEPQPAQNWTGVLNTTETTKICWETLWEKWDLVDDDPRQNEDCLYLNVYTPVFPGLFKKLMPVWVYLYGGKLLNGDASYERVNPQLLVESGIIAVTLNFRSGPLGFLTTEDGVIPANLALRDQHMALRWVQENIRFFNGDPSKVVFAGHSSGAFLVSHHLMSPKSEGLFRGAILQSGTALSPSALVPNAKSIAYKMCKILSPQFSENNSSQELLEFLLKVPARTITYVDIPNVKAEYNIFEQTQPGRIWGPVIERSDLENAFLTKLPYESLLTGNFQPVPLLIGTTSEESTRYMTDIPETALSMDKYTIFFENENIKSGFRDYVEQQVKKMYTNTSFEGNEAAVFKYLSDYMFSLGLFLQAKHHSKIADTYFYQFSYFGKLTQLKPTPYPAFIEEKVGHGEELMYLLLYKEQAASTYPFPSSDLFIQESMVKLWTNFVKYLNPTPKKEALSYIKRWPKVSESHFSYVDINTNMTVIEDFPRSLEKWIPFINDYFKHPLGTL